MEMKTTNSNTAPVLTPAEVSANIAALLDAHSAWRKPSAMLESVIPSKPVGGGLNPLALAVRTFGREAPDLPPEVVAFSLLARISGWALKEGAMIQDEKMGEISPSIFALVLAESGAGKTLCQDIIKQCLPEGFEFDEFSRPGSAVRVPLAAWLRKPTRSQTGFGFVMSGLAS